MKRRYVIAVSHKNMRGFEYLMYSAFSMILLSVLILLPLAPAFASELEAVSTEPQESSETSSPSPEPEATDTEAPQSEPAVEENTVEAEVDNGNDVLATEVVNVESDDDAVELDETVNENSSTETESDVDETESDDTDVATEGAVATNVSGSTTDSVGPESQASSSSDSESVPTEEGVDVDETPDIVLDDAQGDIPPTLENGEAVGTSTTEDTTDVPEASEKNSNNDTEQPNDTEEIVEENVVLGPEPAVINTVVNDDNKFTFSKDECVVVGEGTFYCAEETEVAEVTNTDRIFAALDTEGDKEIYLEKDGNLTALTNNQDDDDAPYFDDVSNTAVWHRLVDGRYQIFEYNFDTDEETQITFDRYNNMQPSRFDSALVWQGWVGDDWEVFLLENDELTMVTDNTVQDITPSVNGTHIVWQSFEGNAWRMKVYDIRTGHIETIEDAEGGSIQNPRFVLVYDTTFESGDVETRGYDLKSGEVVPLSATPAPIPAEIPDPDQTGEERALVSPTNQPKPKTDDELDGDDITPEPELETDVGDVVIPPISQTASSTSSEGDTPETPVDSDVTHISDVIIEVEDVTSTSSVDHIEDVIITPFVPPIESTPDSQDTIAPTV